MSQHSCMWGHALKANTVTKHLSVRVMPRRFEEHDIRRFWESRCPVNSTLVFLQGTCVTAHEEQWLLSENIIVGLHSSAVITWATRSFRALSGSLQAFCHSFRVQFAPSQAFRFSFLTCWFTGKFLLIFFTCRTIIKISQIRFKNTYWNK